MCWPEKDGPEGIVTGVQKGREVMLRHTLTVAILGTWLVGAFGSLPPGIDGDRATEAPKAAPDRQLVFRVKGLT